MSKTSIEIEGLYCKQPDRDAPALTCGYPMPCPHHTVLVVINAPPKRRSRGKR